MAIHPRGSRTGKDQAFGGRAPIWLDAASAPYFTDSASVFAERYGSDRLYGVDYQCTTLDPVMQEKQSAPFVKG